MKAEERPVRHNVRLWAARTLIAILVLCSLFFIYLFYVLYWQWRHQFDESGRYFDSAGMMVYDSSAVYLIIPAAISVVLMLLTYRRISSNKT